MSLGSHLLVLSNHVSVFVKLYLSQNPKTVHSVGLIYFVLVIGNRRGRISPLSDIFGGC